MTLIYILEKKVPINCAVDLVQISLLVAKLMYINDMCVVHQQKFC